MAAAAPGSSPLGAPSKAGAKAPFGQGDCRVGVLVGLFRGHIRGYVSVILGFH